MTGSKLSIFSHPGKITGYWITAKSFPYRPGPIWVSLANICIYFRLLPYFEKINIFFNIIAIKMFEYKD